MKEEKELLGKPLPKDVVAAVSLRNESALNMVWIHPSYHYLSQHLKACFLYLGVFPQNDEFRVSKLILLWGTDGFLGVSYTFLQRYVGGYIREIVSDNVALGTQWSTISPGIKTCSLHSVFWYLCKREAWNEKFLLVLNSYKDVSPEGIASRRRLSIYKNILLSIKDVRESIASMAAVRSLLCTCPNLEKLRVQIELMPGSTEPQSFYDDISHLEELKSLQCVVVNPEPMSVVVSRPASLDSYSFLIKLTLSGCGYPWEDMNEIAKLTFLHVLKLKCYAFRGEKWQVEEGEFQCLTCLSIEDTDLVKWTGGNKNFPSLQLLIMKSCCKLQEIPKLPSLMREIRFVDCNRLAVSCAKQMANAKYCSVYVDSSWTGDRKLS